MTIANEIIGRALFLHQDYLTSAGYPTSAAAGWVFEGRCASGDFQFTPTLLKTKSTEGGTAKVTRYDSEVMIKVKVMQALANNLWALSLGGSGLDTLAITGVVPFGTFAKAQPKRVAVAVPSESWDGKNVNIPIDLLYAIHRGVISLAGNIPFDPKANHEWEFQVEATVITLDAASATQSIFDLGYRQSGGSMVIANLLSNPYVGAGW